MNLNDSPFRTALIKNVRATIKSLRKDGTEAMSLANLMQATPAPSSALKGAPVGTNAAYFYKTMFDSVVHFEPVGAGNFQILK